MSKYGVAAACVLVLACTGCNNAAPENPDQAMLLDASTRFDAAQVLDSAQPPVDLASQEPDCGSPFVYIKDKQFRLGNQPFVPISVNYLFDIRWGAVDRDAGTGGYFQRAGATNGYYIAPSNCVCNDGCCHNPKDCRDAVREQLDQIKGMGINSLRIIDLAVLPNGNLELGCAWETGAGWIDYCPPQASLIVSRPADLAIALDLIADALSMVHDAGLKAVLLAGHGKLDAVAWPADGGIPDAGHIHDQYTHYLTALATRMANEPALFAYDLTNEPFFEFQDKSPDKVINNTRFRAWYDAVRAGTKTQMVTAGLGGIDAIRYWDPGVLPLDFTSVHVYPGWGDAERDFLATYYGWLGRESYPIMVGETGIPVAGGISEADQLAFAQFGLATAWNCGALGLQWWSYRDTVWDANDHFGLVRRDGGVRPAAQAFASFTPTWPRPACIEPAYAGSEPSSDYYHITGRLIHSDGTPVGNGVVRGHKLWVGGWEWTLSKADGTFDLHSMLPVYEVEATATGLSVATPSPGLPDPSSIQHVGDVKLSPLSVSMAISPPYCP